MPQAQALANAVTRMTVNRFTKRTAEALPQIPDVLERLGAAKTLSFFDVQSAFWSVKMKQADKDENKRKERGRWERTERRNASEKHMNCDAKTAKQISVR